MLTNAHSFEYIYKKKRWFLSTTKDKWNYTLISLISLRVERAISVNGKGFFLLLKFECGSVAIEYQVVNRTHRHSRSCEVINEIIIIIFFFCYIICV